MAYILKSERISRKLPEIISVQEFNEILKHTKMSHHKFYFKLAFLCGLRISEIRKLKEENIDLNRGYLFIKQSKWNKDRYVPIPKPLRKELKKFSQYKKIGDRALQMIFKKTVKQVTKRDLWFHCLRHSCATYYLSQGMNIRQVQMLLGHSNISTTSIYLHCNLDELKNQIDEIWK